MTRWMTSFLLTVAAACATKATPPTSAPPRPSDANPDVHPASWWSHRLVPAVGTAAAQPPPKKPKDVSLAAAIAEVPGSVVDSRLIEEDGVEIYEFAIQPENGPVGQLVLVKVDANTGDVTSVDYSPPRGDVFGDEDEEEPGSEMTEPGGY